MQSAGCGLRSIHYGVPPYRQSTSRYGEDPGNSMYTTEKYRPCSSPIKAKALRPRSIVRRSDGKVFHNNNDRTFNICAEC